MVVKILSRLTFILIVASALVWHGCHNTGVAANIFIVLGAAHLGAVAVVTWPRKKEG